MDASSTYQDSLPVSSDALLQKLQDWKLNYNYHQHTPLRTVEDAKSIEDTLLISGEAAFRVKNLFLRDKKKRNYLVTLQQDRAIDLKSLGAQLGIGNLSFGSPERLMQNLGVRPGAVSPLAMINGANQGVRFFLDSSVKKADRAYVHPLVNDRTLGMPVADLMRFFEIVGANPEWLDSK